MGRTKNPLSYVKCGDKYAEKNKWKDAIKEYEIGLRIEDYGIYGKLDLYVSLALAYKELNNLEKEEEYYSLGLSVLLDTEDIYIEYDTYRYLNLLALWLLNKKQDFKTAKNVMEFFIEKYMVSEYLDTYIRILLKAEGKEDAIKYLARQKYKNSGYDDSFDLIHEYNNEINDYVIKNWNEEEKLRAIKSILYGCISSFGSNDPDKAYDFILNGIEYNEELKVHLRELDIAYISLKLSFLDDENIVKRFLKLVFRLEASNNIYMEYDTELIKVLLKSENYSISYEEF